MNQRTNSDYLLFYVIVFIVDKKNTLLFTCREVFKNVRNLYVMSFTLRVSLNSNYITSLPHSLKKLSHSTCQISFIFNDLFLTVI